LRNGGAWDIFRKDFSQSKLVVYLQGFGANTPPLRQAPKR